MKKITFFCLIFLLMSSCCFAATKGNKLKACPLHNNNAGTIFYYYDNDGHYTACSIGLCKNFTNPSKIEKHSFVNGVCKCGFTCKHDYVEGVCKKCKYKKHTHLYNGENGNSQCVICKQYSYKTISKKCDKCNTNLVYKWNAHRHWVSCNKCNKVVEGNEYHKYNNSSVCTVCGGISATASNQIGSCGHQLHYRFHQNSHWLHCDICGTVKNSGKAHEFDVENHNGLDCKICGFVCADETKGPYYKQTNPKTGEVTVWTTFHMYVCGNKNHKHYESDDQAWDYIGWSAEHIDNGKGTCRFCNYPCINGHSLDAAGNCSKCGNSSTTPTTPATPSTPSTPSTTNQCTKCDGIIQDTWLKLGGNHYRACDKNKHEFYVEAHVDADGNNICEICNLTINDTITAVPENTCPTNECKGTIIDEWVELDGSHAKKCTNGCTLYEAIHIDSGDLVCDICNLTVTRCYVEDCRALLKEGWMKTADGKHYKECTNGHPSYIKEHEFDGTKCKICEFDKDTTTPEDTTTLENACPVKGCKGTIVDDWVELDGSHAKKCTNGCTLYEAIHIDSEDLICDICNLTVTKCYIEDCRALLKEGWMKTADGKHYKECTNGHPSYIKEHEFDGTKCKLCGFDKLQIKPIEMKCNKCKSDAYWEQTGTMHVLVCKAQKTHVVLIEGHNIAEGECLVCKYKETEKLESSFTDLPKIHWAYRNIAYMEKLNIAKGTTYGNGEKVILPEEIIKAEEFVALIARIVGYRDLDEIPDDSVYNPFGKEIENSWTRGHWKYLLNYIEKKVGKDAKAEMMTVLANNTISGTDAEIVENYKKPITRERAVYLLGTLMGDQALRQVIGKGLADDFKDWEEVSSVSFKYKVELLSAYDVLKGVLDTGTGELYIQPKGELTRAQAIALIDRFNSIRELKFSY